MSVVDWPASMSRSRAAIQRVPQKHAGPRGTKWSSLPAAMALLAMLISGYRVGVPGLWLDEGATLTSAERPWHSLARLLDNVDAVHGFYYVLMHLWLGMVGTTPFTLRLPSVLAVAVSTGLVVVLGTRLGGRWTGFFSGLAFIMLPTVSWMASEGRSYAIATAATTLTMLVFLQALNSDRGWPWWAAYGLLLFLTISVFAFTLFVFAILPLVMLSIGAGFRKWLFSGIASVIAVLMATPLLLEIRSQGTQVSWISEPSMRRVVALPRDVWFQYSGSHTYVVVGWIVLTAGVASMIFLAQARLWSDISRNVRLARIVLLVGWLTLPAVVLILWSILGTNLYVPRYLAPTTPALALIFGLGIASIRPRVMASLPIIALLLIWSEPYVKQREVDAKAPTALAAAVVSEQLRPRDAVLFLRDDSGHDWTRLSRYTYPEAFGEARDLNLGAPVDETNRVMEPQVPLSRVPERLTGVSRILAVRPPDPSREGISDLALLHDYGFVRVSNLSAGTWTIDILERTM